jgi:hypothetical protein
MTSFTLNLNAANDIARRTIAERVHDAEQRARAREARRRARPVAPPRTHDLPAWTFRFLRTVH